MVCRDYIRSVEYVHWLVSRKTGVWEDRPWYPCLGSGLDLNGKVSISLVEAVHSMPSLPTTVIAYLIWLNWCWMTWWNLWLRWCYEWNLWMKWCCAVSEDKILLHIRRKSCLFMHQFLAENVYRESKLMRMLVLGSVWQFWWIPFVLYIIGICCTCCDSSAPLNRPQELTPRFRPVQCHPYW